MLEEIKRIESEEEYAKVFNRVEELMLGLPEDTPEDDPLMIELKSLGDMVADYEEINYPIG